MDLALKISFMQLVSGIYTASVYCDKQLRDNGFPGECIRNESVVVIKSHAGEKSNQHVILQRPIEKVILLTRDPYDTLKAFYNFQKAGHTGLAIGSQLSKIEGKVVVKAIICHWCNIMLK